MSAALEKACTALRLRLVDDAVTRLVAEKIVELTQRGVQGSDTLASLTLQELKISE
jgi:hypothetical protein